MSRDPEKCPKCGAVRVESGYGLYGGGIGSYWYCTANDCDWFHKEPDPAYPETAPRGSKEVTP